MCVCVCVRLIWAAAARTRASNGRREKEQVKQSQGQGEEDEGIELTLEDEFERKMDSKLDKIGGALSKLGNLAGDMGAELQYQSRVLIPELDARVEMSKDRTRDLDKRTRRLAR